ncbi:Hypothetical predicted protein [Mytilus galloprovincialis]|uniref:Uncharacterized protein n=1 Tax=Mytilus galloprovincialis TaxID=29158 RepID=A0A8B6G739_MYTGA|nr:Hypothetical predicted protein [Mytilus galloprovincialis]
MVVGIYIPNDAVSGDMGLKPPCVKRWINIFRRWSYCTKMDNNRINYKVFRWSVMKGKEVSSDDESILRMSCKVVKRLHLCPNLIRFLADKEQNHLLSLARSTIPQRLHAVQANQDHSESPNHQDGSDLQGCPDLQGGPDHLDGPDHQEGVMDLQGDQ